VTEAPRQGLLTVPRVRRGGAKRGAIAAAALCAFFAAQGALAGSVWLPGLVNVNVPTTSVEELKFDEVVRQQYDFSCGSAALATLLTYHYDDPTDEIKAFNFMYERGDQARIAQAGFSLLDMKRYLEANGYQADGYQSDLKTLANAGIPAIALINYRGYRHFVVVKGMRGGRVLLADPALGTRLVTEVEFEGMWENGVLFIIKNKADVGKRFFNTDQQWRGLAYAPLGAALGSSDLAALTVNLPQLGEF
jgi:predicted double-glycine peptidase